VLATLLAGDVAVELIFNERTTGAHDDILRATELARRMVTDYGMSDKLGMRTFGNKQEMVFLGREIAEQKDYSERTALAIDREIDSLIEEGRNCAVEILTKQKAKLKGLATMLINQETLEGDALEKAFGNIGISRPKPKVKKTTIPAPVAPVGEGEKVVKPQKAPGVPQLVPKQTPAPSD
jgi:cell division protease FtsH